MFLLKTLYAEYCANKKFLISYIVFCVFFGMTGGFLLSEFSPTYVYAAEPVATGETIWLITQNIVGTSVAGFAGTYSSLVGVSCEPFAALLFIGIIENVNRWIGSPFAMMETPLGNIWVLLVVAIFFAISKLMKSNEATQILGIVTLGELERFTGLAFIIVIGIMNITGLTSVEIHAAGTDGVISAGGIAGVISGILSVLFAIMSIVVFFIIKTVMKGLDIIQMSLTFIPGITLVVEVLKTVITFSVIFVNIVCPPLGIAINIIIFIICCFLFKYCYRATKYFKAIYVKPFIRMIRGFKPQIPLLVKRIPRKFRKYYKNKELPEIMIPIYSLKYVGEVKVKKYQKWFFIVENGCTSFKKMRLFKKNPLEIVCTGSDINPVYIRKGLRFFEVFHYIDTNENLAKKYPKKDFSFVYSKEYFYRFDEIVAKSGLTDYEVLRQARKAEKEQKKMEKAMLRQERREERHLLREERRLAAQEARFIKINQKERG